MRLLEDYLGFTGGGEEEGGGVLGGCLDSRMLGMKNQKKPPPQKKNWICRGSKSRMVHGYYLLGNKFPHMSSCKYVSEKKKVGFSCSVSWGI